MFKDRYYISAERGGVEGTFFWSVMLCMIMAVASLHKNFLSNGATAFIASSSEFLSGVPK